MKIIVENSGYHLKNLGDLAMLQVALDRFKKFDSNVEFTVLTTEPDKLVSLFPNVQPLTPEGRNFWFSPLVGSLSKLFTAEQGWSTLEHHLRYKLTPIFKILLRSKLTIKSEDVNSVEQFLSYVEAADLVVATGGGYLTDAFKRHAIAALNLLDLATHLNKPTVLLGQGIGPLNNPELIAKAKHVLPKVDLIALRESCVSPSILKELNVPENRIVVTGDDAIELSYLARQPALGTGIGVNLRVANYSGINSALLELIRASLHQTAREFNAPLIPVPIETAAIESYCSPDSDTIHQLLQGYDDESDGGRRLASPTQVIEQVRRCRVVVTGSYHAGVFALSQGIPVIGLAKSEYYVNKFAGLATQFNTGCEIILLTEPDFQEKLTKSIRQAWNLADQLRPQLIDAAEAQIELGKQVYEKVNRIVLEKPNSL
ncbi:MAG TPA: polysaccharide pyruvyl transferase family protein [Leptolyngbyaceae cyanobacterium M33_DOE_097]|nr:polysaccharide pyruvyl transferase family protein [Leptolyngbyaceae cyanobacterium M33_DOE_097]